MNTKNQLAVNILLSIISFLICALAIEVIFMMYPGHFNSYVISEYSMPHVFMEDKNITWTLKPNSSSIHKQLQEDFVVTVNVDERGLRRTNFSEGKKNILVLGDSYTFGFGVEDNETYPAYLGKLLENYNVLNGGYASGMALDTQYLYLKGNYDRFKAEVVIIQFLSGNDFEDIEANQWVEDENGLPINIKTEYSVDSDGLLLGSKSGSFRGPVIFLRKNSYLFNFLWDKKNEIFGTLIKKSTSRQALEKSTKLAEAVQKFAEENNFKVAFLFMPSVKNAVRPDLKSVYDEYENELKNFMKQKEIEFFEFNISDFSRLDIRFRRDPHLNSKGNEIVAEKLYDMIKNRGILTAG